MTQRHILVANIFFAPFSYGGATIVAEQVARALQRTGDYRISAVSLCARADLAPYAVIKTQKDGITNYLINMPPHRTYGEMYVNAEVTTRLAELISALEPDVIHAHCIQEIGTGLIYAAEGAGVPLILSVHDFWWLCERQFMIRVDEKYCGQSPVRIDACKGCVENFWAAKMRRDHLSQMAAKAAVITYPSRFAKELSEASGFGRGQGVVWENGVRQPGPGFFEEQARRRAKDSRVTFGYLGGPAHIKGWPQIRAAFKGLGRGDFRGLVVEGSLDGSWWSSQDLRGLPGRWQVFPRFEQAEIDSFYARIDVLLFMSQWRETFGLAIREALARGITVIQTDSGGTTEHGVIPAERLIPIGAPPDALQRQLEAALDRLNRARAPIKVPDFDDQARALIPMIDQVLGARRKAA